MEVKFIENLWNLKNITLFHTSRSLVYSSSDIPSLPPEDVLYSCLRSCCGYSTLMYSPPDWSLASKVPFQSRHIHLPGKVEKMTPPCTRKMKTEGKSEAFDADVFGKTYPSTCTLSTQLIKIFNFETVLRVIHKIFVHRGCC